MGGFGDIIFTWARRMGWKRDLTLENFDSRLRIQVMVLWSFPICLYRICNVFHPRTTWGVRLCTHINVTTFTHLRQNWSLSCLLALYGATMHPAQLCGGFWTIFFLLGVWAPWNYTLCRKTKERGELGALGDVIFTQAHRMGQNTRFDSGEFWFTP